MPHTLFTATQAAQGVLASLRYLSVLPRTVRMDYSSEFVPGRGTTVNVLGPISAGEAKIYDATKRGKRDAIEFNDLAQTFVPVKLENQLYNAVRLPDDWNTFTLEDFGRQVLNPQAESVVDALAKPLVEEMKKISAETGAKATVAADGTSNVLQSITKLRSVLNARKVPLADRTLAVGVDWEAALLNLPLLQKANEHGDGGSMLREATIGKLLGFDIVVAPDLPADKAIAYHKDAFAFVTRPSKAPQGAAYSATVAQDGFALRHIVQYNPLQLEDQSVVDTFYGAATLDANRAVAAVIAAAAA